jgi:arylsulfatase A-like enzyme
MKFTRAYTNAALCVPTRYSCLTGSYASRCEVRWWGPLDRQAYIGNGSFFTGDEKTIAMALQQAGYYTGATGKWHNATVGNDIHLMNIPKDADPVDAGIVQTLRNEQKKLSDDIKKYGFDYADYLIYPSRA